MNKYNKIRINKFYKYLTLAFIFFMIGCSNTKNYSDIDVYIEDGVHYENKTKKPINGQIIRKFDSGEIRSKWPYKNGLADGQAKNYFKSGEIQAKVYFKNGKKDGKQTIYHSNGQENEVSSYKEGELNGHYVVFLTSGKIETEAQYINGKLESKKTYTYYDSGVLKKENFFENGQLECKKKYYENGNLKSEIFNNHNDTKQIIKEYSPMGVRTREIKVNGNKLYSVIYYNPIDGKIEREDFCTNSDSLLRKKYSDEGDILSEETIQPKKSFYSQMNISCNKHIKLY